MRELHRLSCLPIPWLLLLASCSSPPKPPTVDESQKRPANTAMAVELQVCKNDLQNTRILATESGRIADSTTATLQQLAARQQAIAATASARRQPAPQANSVFAVRFDFGSTRVAIPAELSAALVEEARSAPLVVLQGPYGRHCGHARPRAALPVSVPRRCVTSSLRRASMSRASAPPTSRSAITSAPGKAAATSFKTDMASPHLLSFGRLSAACTDP